MLGVGRLTASTSGRNAARSAKGRMNEKYIIVMLNQSDGYVEQKGNLVTWRYGEGLLDDQKQREASYLSLYL